ncbi:MAG: MFS transporter [bacterium]|nr:MFS transporter [bacterium]
MKTLRKNRLWVYLFPALMDLSVAAVVIFSAIKVVEFGTRPFVVGILGSVWGITYFVSSFVLSKVITRRNSRSFMVLSCMGFILIGLFFDFFNTLGTLFILLIIGGLFSAFFFVGFQLFMEHNTGTSASRASAFYTLSWSIGAAFGSIAEGFLMGKSSMYARIPVLIPPLLIIAGIFLSQIDEGNHIKENIYDDKKSDYIVKVYAKIAWLEIFAVTLITVGIRYLLPKMTMSFLDLNQNITAIAIFLFFVLQSISGYFSSYFRVLRYNIFTHDLLKILAGISLLVPVLFPCGFSIFLFVCVLGIYAGHAYYAVVFYAINHRHQAGFNVGINESLVGVASVMGPFLFGIMLNFGISQFLLFPWVVFTICSFFQHRILKRLNQS